MRDFLILPFAARPRRIKGRQTLPPPRLCPIVDDMMPIFSSIGFDISLFRPFYERHYFSRRDDGAYFRLIHFPAICRAAEFSACHSAGDAMTSFARRRFCSAR